MRFRVPLRCHRYRHQDRDRNHRPAFTLAVTSHCVGTTVDFDPDTMPIWMKP
ncbi:MAG: hypothetical protein ACOX7Q_09865 [Kiritimatiellia bacterium]|nr:hypothetical protein [Kiritimatiellia bacterium]HHU13923.1 hypothetical protein [Lentisphaerota bacterium]